MTEKYGVKNSFRGGPLPESRPPPPLEIRLAFLGWAWTSPTLAWSTGTRASTNQLTDRPCPFHSRDTDTLHVPTLARHIRPCHASAHVRAWWWTVQCAVVISIRPRMLTMGKRKAETFAQQTVRLEQERPVNLFILVLSCQCRHPWLSRTSVFSPVTLHKTFSHFSA